MKLSYKQLEKFEGEEEFDDLLIYGDDEEENLYYVGIALGTDLDDGGVEKTTLPALAKVVEKVKKLLNKTEEPALLYGSVGS